MSATVKLYIRVKDAKLIILWRNVGEVCVRLCQTKVTKIVLSACDKNHSQQAETQAQSHAKMDTKIALYHLICEHSSSCARTAARGFVWSHEGTYSTVLCSYDFLRLILPRDLCHMPSPFISFIHFVLTINCSVKQKGFKINLYKTPTFHSASGWQTFWQTAGTMCGWQHICQTGARQKYFSTISPSERTSSYLFLNICGWHHCGATLITNHYMRRYKTEVTFSGCAANNLAMTTKNRGRLTSKDPSCSLLLGIKGKLSPAKWTGKTLEYYQVITEQQHGTFLHVAIEDAQGLKAIPDEQMNKLAQSLFLLF